MNIEQTFLIDLFNANKEERSQSPLNKIEPNSNEFYKATMIGFVFALFLVICSFTVNTISISVYLCHIWFDFSVMNCRSVAGNEGKCDFTVDSTKTTPEGLDNNDVVMIEGQSGGSIVGITPSALSSSIVGISPGNTKLLNANLQKNY